MHLFHFCLEQLYYNVSCVINSASATTGMVSWFKVPGYTPC